MSSKWNERIWWFPFWLFRSYNLLFNFSERHIIQFYCKKLSTNLCIFVFFSLIFSDRNTKIFFNIIWEGESIQSIQSLKQLQIRTFTSFVKRKLFLIKDFFLAEIEFDISRKLFLFQTNWLGIILFLKLFN